MVREGRDKSVWKPGTILERRGPVSYLVQMDGGQMQRKHVDHIWEVSTPPAVITSEVAKGPSTVSPHPEQCHGRMLETRCQTPTMLRIQCQWQSCPRYPLPWNLQTCPQCPGVLTVHLCALILVVSKSPLSDLPVLDNWLLGFLWVSAVSFLFL